MDTILSCTVAFVVVCCKTVIGIECKSKTYKGQVPCGDDMCCCSRRMNIARCNTFGRNRTDLPSLPTTIRHLYVENNSFPIVSRSIFNNLKASKITKLILKSDDIMNVTEDAFLDFKALTQLALSKNENLNISSLSSAFNSLPYGRKFRLCLNNIGMINISDDFLNNLYHKNVISMELSGNRFNVLNISVFRKMEYLKELTFSYSEIYYIASDIALPTLQLLDLSNNQICSRTLPFCRKDGHDTLFPQLKRLDLQENSLTGFSTKDWNCLKRLQYLDISKNRIVILKNNMFAGLASLTELWLSNLKGRIKEIEKNSFNSSSLARLQLDGNAIKFTSAMTNIFNASTNLKILSLSRNNFYNTDDLEIMKIFSPLKNLTTLYVNKANMRLPEGFLELFPNLEYLYMDYNKDGIQSLGDSLKNTKNLKVVSLQGNAIRIVDKISFNGYTMGSVQTLNLAENPFECTCENMWFRNAIDSQGKIGNIILQRWPFYYRCNKEIHTHMAKNPMFSLYKPTSLSCQNILLIALICSISIMVLGSITVILVYRYRWYLTYWVYKSKTRRVDPEIQPLLTNEDATTRQGVVYDAFVIYDSADAMFVHHDFRLLMEEKFGYKLHIWERDASAVQTKVSIVADAMCASKYVVAVISDNALEDSWLQFQINIALDRQIYLKRDFLILILLESIDVKKMSKFWCVLFTRLLSTRWSADENSVKRNVFEQKILKHFGKTFQESV